MSDKIQVLLDVDGVLNPDPFGSFKIACPPGYMTHIMSPDIFWNVAGRPFRVWLNPSHGDLLMDFASTYDVELVWATMWEHEASRLIGPAIGLPEIPFIHFSGPGYKENWKYAKVLEYVGDRPLIWFDDDFGTIRSDETIVNAKFWEQRRDLFTVLYPIHQSVGLTEFELEVVGKMIHEAFTVS